jgi:hypothetical protein
VGFWKASTQPERRNDIHMSKRGKSNKKNIYVMRELGD